MSIQDPNETNYGTFNPMEDVEQYRETLEGLGVDLSGGEEGNPLSRILSGIGGFLGGGGGQGLAGLGLLLNAYNRLGGIGERGLGLGQDLATTQMEQAAFRPYTVTTATGGQFMAGPDGQYTMAMSPEERAFQQRMFGGAGDFFAQSQADPRLREDEIYGQISEALAPKQRAQQLGLEERLAAQGRLGVRTAEFGGTPEALAMQKAQAQQLSQARLGAAQQARQEQAGLSALGQQYLMGSYLPQQQMLAALAPGQTAAGAAQQAQLYGTGLFGEATASGIDALLASSLGQANLMGEAGTGLLSGLFGARSSTATNPFATFIEAVTGG